MADNDNKEEDSQIEIVTEVSDDERAQIEQMILSAFGEEVSVSTAIYNRESQRLLDKESFRVIFKNQRVISNHVTFTILKIYYLKLVARYSKLLTMIYQNDRGEVVDEVYNVLDTNQKELIELRKLLSIVGKASRKLKRNDTSACNFQINNLLSLIYEKEMILYNRIVQCVDMSRLSTRGITYVVANKNQEALDETNEQIAASVKALGLYKETPSDK